MKIYIHAVFIWIESCAKEQRSAGPHEKREGIDDVSAIKDNGDYFVYKFNFIGFLKLLICYLI